LTPWPWLAGNDVLLFSEDVYGASAPHPEAVAAGKLNQGRFGFSYQENIAASTGPA
jgi:hypothetical protein